MSKERFTNNYHDFSNQIKLELIAPLDDGALGRSYFVYAEISAFPVDRFAIHILRTDTWKLLFRKWNSDFDNTRFSLGIYNIDRVAISECIIELTKEQENYLKNIFPINISVSEFKGIILDGYSYYLTTYEKEFQKTYEWQDHSQIDSRIVDLITVLKKWSNN